MKQKLNVKIYKTGTESDKLLRLVGNVNEGKAQVSVRELEGYFATQNAVYPSLTQISLIKGDSPNEYHVSEDGGKTFTMSLEWADLFELTEKEALSKVWPSAKDYLPNNINA